MRSVAATIENSVARLWSQLVCQAGLDDKGRKNAKPRTPAESRRETFVAMETITAHVHGPFPPKKPSEVKFESQFLRV